MNKSTTILAVAALLSGAAGFWVSQQLNADPPVEQPARATVAADARSTDEANEPDLIGAPMPAFELPNLAGETKTARDYLGKPLLVNFWATWCAPCRREMPELMALHAERGDEVAVVGIAMDLQQDVVRFIEEMNIQYPILIVDDLAGTELITEFGNPTGMLPYTVFVDADGLVQKMHLGPITLEQVEQELANLM